LVLIDGDSFVVIDHKCPVGTRDEAMAAAPGYAGQLSAYADTIAASTGKRCGGSYLHLVTRAIVVGIGSRSKAESA
jgi:hypothetical protein